MMPTTGCSGIKALRVAVRNRLSLADKFTRRDAVDTLENEEDMALYLDACLDEDHGDSSLVRAALNDMAGRGE